MKHYILYFVMIIIVVFLLFLKKERFIGKLSPLKKNMPYDLRCIPEIKKKKLRFNNSTLEYYVRPKCLKTI